MKGIRVPVAALATLALMFFIATASAAVIGDLKTGSGGTVTVTLSSITFNPDPSSSPPGPPWNGEVANGTNLSFFNCSGVLNSPGCLQATEAIEIANNNPITLGAGLGPNNPFISFVGNGTTHATVLYTVSTLGPGSANTNCAGAVNVGDSCSVFSGSPIILTKTSSGTTVSLPGAGTVSDGHGLSNWVGQFQVPIAGMSPAQIQTFYCPSGTCTAADFAANRALSSSQSGDFVSTVVPEPGTISMALIGGGLIAFAMRRRKSRA